MDIFQALLESGDHDKGFKGLLPYFMPHNYLARSMVFVFYRGGKSNISQPVSPSVMD